MIENGYGGVLTDDIMHFQPLLITSIDDAKSFLVLQILTRQPLGRYNVSSNLCAQHARTIIGRRPVTR
jgi:hypothetical protein